MSLILDALRKSEAERRRGQAPDMYSATPISLSSRRIDPLRLWPVLVFALLVAIAGVVFWRGPASTPAATAPAPAAADATTDERDEVAAAIAADRLANPPSAGAPTNPPPRKADASDATRTAATTSPLPAPDAGQPASSPSPAFAPLPPVTNAAPSAGQDAGDDEPAPPSLAVLDGSERAALPPLKLSMHVWASEPARRFAIVDGQRVTEGSSLGAGVVAQIRRDGVVLEIGGRRFLLPRP